MQQFTRKKIICIVLMISVLTTLFAGCGDDKYVQQVKNGQMEMLPNVPVGKAFDQFFKNGKWESFKSTDNKRVVEFNGECLWNNKPAKAKVQFVILNDTQFQLWTVTINGSTMYQIDGINILAKILRQHQK